jgi:quercetin dioxygenase-like cupin family protein
VSTVVTPQPPLHSVLQSIASVRASAPGGTLAVAETRLRAGEMPPLHAHGQDEAMHVVDGRLTVHLSGETVELEAGEHLIVPAHAPHTYRAGESGARALTVTFARSVRGYQDFLRAVAAPPASGSAQMNEEESAALHAIAAASNTIVLGAPGALPNAA